MAATESIRVTVVLAPAPRTVWEASLVLSAPCSADQAWAQTEWSQSYPDVHLNQAWSVSIWGRKVSGDTLLRDGDRVEWLRPLTVDPKVARRERFKGQGIRGAGLFSRRKPSA